ncbi:hypothetical protein Q5752_005384 [Cryptotrichosporon argae]
MYDDKKLQEARAVLMEHAKTVLDSMQGDGWTAAQLDAQSDFARPAYEFMWSGAYDGIWARPGLERKYRSLSVISMLAAMGKLPELRPHVRIGLVNGLTEDEIRECLIHVMGYCGYPAGMEAFKVADEVIKEWKAEQKTEQKTEQKE